MEHIVKYNRPTSYDLSLYGQIWIAELDGSTERYIQLSRDENVALWSKLGDFLENNYKQEHLDEYLDLWKY